MKNVVKLLLLAAMFLGMNSCGNKQEKVGNEPQTTGFKLGTGVNVSHWLSQSQLRGTEREELITKKDFDSIAAMGFDHVRLPIDEEQLYDEQMNRHKDAFQLMHNAINWALENNMNVIVDLHIIRAHHFNNENESANTLFEKEEEQEKMINIWLDLQKDLMQYPNDRVAYELMNEAVAPTDKDWNQLIAKLIAAIRVKEPERIIVVGSNMWQTVETFHNLNIPENDRNLILSFHFYYPLVVTHYRAPWIGSHAYDGAIQYPGQAIDPALYESLDPALVTELKKSNGVWNKERLAETMKPAIDKAKELNLPLYCGEFGAYPVYIDKETRLRWYQDIADVFRENNINNAHWCYKGDFPIVNSDTSANELPAILLGK